MLKHLAVPLGLVLAFAGTGADAALAGKERDIFVEHAEKACLKTQIDHPDNEGVSAKILLGFCTCRADYVADRISPDDLDAADKAINEGKTPVVLAKLSQEATDQCLEGFVQRGN